MCINNKLQQINREADNKIIASNLIKGNENSFYHLK